MTTIYIDSPQDANQVDQLVRSAIVSEIKRLELALTVARRRLEPFEQKYRVTSETFVDEMVAEDLEGGDDEYVRWSGEYQLMLRLREKLRQLQEIEYGDLGILRPDQSDG